MLGRVASAPTPVGNYNEIEGSFNPMPKERGWKISPYDPVISRAGRLENQDWRLLAAIAYVESGFTADAVSYRGACGLMQIMPSVALEFNIDSEDIMKPEINVLIAAKLLNIIEQTFRFSVGTSDLDRKKIVLASYNAGLGHILDARRMAEQNGENRNSWETVEKYLKMKSDVEDFNDEIVRNGVFNGSRETINFVNRVIDKYNSYVKAYI
jgi:membrane-bound lytic murein transglycosylase F